MLLRAGAVCTIVAAALGPALGGVARAQAPAIPLPPDLRIDTTADDVPANVSRFDGAWAHGAWDGVLPHVLAVETFPGPGWGGGRRKRIAIA